MFNKETEEERVRREASEYREALIDITTKAESGDDMYEIARAVLDEHNTL